MSEATIRERLCMWGTSLFDRGLTSGSSGNISVRVERGFLMTPTNSCLGLLDPAQLSLIDAGGNLISGDKPSKEVPLHLAFYEARPQAGAVVHLHSSYAVAWSCRADLDADDALPALTPYVLMRVGRVPVLPFFQPGTDQVRAHLLRVAPNHGAVLLANHGPVVSGADLDAAAYAAEELEEAAKIAWITQGASRRELPADAVSRLIAQSRS